jgi:acyl-CoA thioesterase-1
MSSWCFRLACGLLVAVSSWARPVVAAKIACVGDSITAGYGLSNPSQQSYPSVLQTLLGAQHTVQNFGTSGCTLLKKGDKPYWNDGNYGASNTFKPDIVVIILGTNDAKPQNWSHKAEFAGDYASLISHYRGLGAQVFAATPPPVIPPGAFDISADVLNDEIVPLVRQIAADERAPLIEVFAALSGKDSYFPDKIHPNAEGAKLLAQTVATALQGGAFGGTGGTTGTGGMRGSGGFTSGTGGSGTGTGGSLGSGGFPRASGGRGAGTGGGATGSGGATRGSGGVTTASGGSGGAEGGAGAAGVSGSNGGAGSGGSSARGGQAGGSGGVAAGGSLGSGGSTIPQAGEGGCSCRVSGRNPVHPAFVVLACLLLLGRRRPSSRRGPEPDEP